MSKTFNLVNLILNIIKPSFTPVKLPQKAVYTILGTVVTTSGIYTYTTVNNKDITIVNKYKFNRYGFTEFMVIDENGNHYNFNNNFWFFKFDNIEDYYKLKEGDTVNIYHCGWRIPFLGLFPNVYKSLKHYSNKK
jgi:hypothetical protein